MQLRYTAIEVEIQFQSLVYGMNRICSVVIVCFMSVAAGTLPGFHWGELMATCHQHCQLVTTTSAPLTPTLGCHGDGWQHEHLCPVCDLIVH